MTDTKKVGMGAVLVVLVVFTLLIFVGKVRSPSSPPIGRADDTGLYNLLIEFHQDVQEQIFDVYGETHSKLSFADGSPVPIIGDYTSNKLIKEVKARLIRDYGPVKGKAMYKELQRIRDAKVYRLVSLAKEYGRRGLFKLLKEKGISYQVNAMHGATPDNYLFLVVGKQNVSLKEFLTQKYLNLLPDKFREFKLNIQPRLKASSLCKTRGPGGILRFCGRVGDKLARFGLKGLGVVGTVIGAGNMCYNLKFGNPETEFLFILEMASGTLDGRPMPGFVVKAAGDVFQPFDPTFDVLTEALRGNLPRPGAQLDNYLFSLELRIKRFLRSLSNEDDEKIERASFAAFVLAHTLKNEADEFAKLYAEKFPDESFLPDSNYFLSWSERFLKLREQAVLMGIK